MLLFLYFSFVYIVKYYATSNHLVIQKILLLRDIILYEELHLWRSWERTLLDKLSDITENIVSVQRKFYEVVGYHIWGNSGEA